MKSKGEKREEEYQGGEFGTVGDGADKMAEVGRFMGFGRGKYFNVGG